jgi:hypothetical protein
MLESTWSRAIGRDAWLSDPHRRYTSDIATNVQAECDSRDLTIRAVQRPEWFFQ